MSDYPQERIETMQNVITEQRVRILTQAEMIETQQAKIAHLQTQTDNMYNSAMFYKEQWEAAKNKLAIYEAKE